MGFLDFARKHIVGCFAIVVGIAACAVTASSFAKSKSEYDDYLVEYEEMQERVKGDVPQLPKSVVMDDEYVSYSGDDIASSKSSYTKYFVYYAKDAVVAPLSNTTAQEYKKIDSDGEAEGLNAYISSLDRSGGAITFKIKAEESGLADVAINLSSNWKNASNEIIAYENITDQIKIQFNKLEVKTEECGLPAQSGTEKTFSTLVLKDVLLLKGNNTLTFTTSAYNPYKTDSNKILYVMPDIQNVSVMSSVEIVMPEAK